MNGFLRYRGGGSRKSPEQKRREVEENPQISSSAPEKPLSMAVVVGIQYKLHIKFLLRSNSRC